MSNDLTVLLSGMLASFAGGIGLMLLVGRRTVPADPVADTERELKMVELTDAVADARATNDSLAADLAYHQDQLARSEEHLKTLEQQVGTYLRQYAVSKDILKKELLQKNALMAELAASNAQVTALRGRIQELELGQTGSRTRPPVHG